MFDLFPRRLPSTKSIPERSGVAIEDDSACVLLCDSYGNAFAPFLVDHYHTVYVKDFRYTDPDIVDFCAQNNVTDLIVLNTMKISSAKSTLAQLQIDLLGQ